MANGNFDFQLPDGRIIRVEGAPSEEAARTFMDTQWPTLRREMPIEGFGESFGQQFRGQFGAVPGAAQAAAAAVGAPETAATLGRAREFVAPGDTRPGTRAPELRDIVRNPIDALSAFAGQAAGAVVGGIATIGAGAGIGAVVGGPGGAATGATVGLVGGSVLGSVDELYQGLVAEGVDPQRAGVLATTAGAAIGGVEAAALGPVLRRVLGSQVNDAIIDRVAARLVGGRAGGIRQTAALGAGGEMAGETARQGVIAAETGNLDLAGRGERVLESGIVGGIAGGGVGAGLRVAGRAGPAPGEPPAPAAPPESAFEPTPPLTPAPEAAPPPRMAPLTVPDRPEPFTTREEAEAFIAENPQFTPPAALATPEATIGFVNAARVSNWEQSVQQTRAQAVNEFFPRAPDTNQLNVSDAISNLAEAANRGDLNLNAFSPNAVAKAALASRDIDPARVTKAEVKASADQLDALAQAGVIRKESPTKYAVNYGAPTPTQPAPTPAPTPEAAAPTTGAIPPAAQGTPIPEAAPTQAAPEAAPVKSTNQELREGGTLRLVVDDASGQRLIRADDPAAPRDAPLALFSKDGQFLRYLSTPRRPDVSSLPPPRVTPAATVSSQATTSAPTAAAPAQPTARTTVEVDGVRRETTPETLQQTVDEIRTGQTAAPATPQEEQLARAAANLDPASGAGETTRTAEEARLNTPKDMPLKEQRKVLDAQYKDVFQAPPEGFRKGWWRKWFASTLTGLGRQPIYQQVAGVGRNIVDRKYQATTDFALMHEPLRTLSPESQARTALTLQEASSRRQSWNRDAFTPEENLAMDGVVKMGQRGLDYMIDAYTTKFFNPANVKDAGQRARLEAFQQAKGRRLITDFSDAELRALSEEGAREVRSYNARRNPFYLPQVAMGSHFVAAYKRLPGGKKGELVRIYFYNPLTFAQRQRARVGAQRDFETLSLQALRDEFPDGNRFLITPRGIESTQDQQAANLKDSGEFIARYLDDLKRVSGADAQRILARMSREIDKSKMDRFFKPNEDKLRAVTPWNAVDYARETLPNYYLALANMQARVANQEDFVRAQAGFSREEKDYWDKWLNFNSTPIEALGAGRALAGAWFLGGNISTAMIQLTQNPVLLPARFARDGAGGLGTRMFGSAARDVYGAAGGLKGLGKELEYSKYLANSKKLAADEVTAFKRAIDEGVVRPSTIINMRGQFDADDFRRLGIADKTAASFSNGANTTIDVLFRFLNAADETNRAVAFLAALRVAKANPQVMTQAGRLDNRTYANPYEYAKDVTEQTNFMGGPEDQPLIARFHPVAQVMTQFLTPSFKFLELFARSMATTVEGLRKSDPTMAKAGAVMFGLMMSMQIALAGLWSLPFADRLKELVEFVLSKVFDVEMDFEQELEKLFGSSLLAASLNYGLPHATNTVTLSERLKIDVLPQGSISEWDIFSLMGPVGGLVEKPLTALNAYSNNDYWGVAYALFPTAAANILKGIQIGTMGEQWTQAGTRIITPQDVERASQEGLLPPAVRQAIGFAPPEFTDIRRGVRRAQEMREPLQRDTEKANRELARIMLRMYEAQILGQTSEVQALSAQLQRRAAEINAEQEGKPEHLRVRLNRRAVEERALQDLQGRGSLETLLRRAPAAQREEVRRMYERTIGIQPQ